MTSSQWFHHPYLPQTKAQVQTMLETIGVSSIEDLFSGIPENLRFDKNLSLPYSFSEQKVLSLVKEILEHNKPFSDNCSFLGAGIYNHFIPTVVSTILARSEFYTSYTPYAPEISQGMLQALWEYQSLIAELTKLDVVNSSMYDMATALGEAALMCTRITRKEVFLVPNYLQPERFQTLLTYAKGPEISVKTYPYDKEKGTVNLDALKEIVESLNVKISGIYIENPNFWGLIEEEVKKVAKIAHSINALFVVGVDPISLGILKSPGDYDADIAIGEGQSLGLPMNFGGPLLGLFAVKNNIKFYRSMPGRIIGITTEQNSSKRAFTMTLQTREQHIRREKATSNICTNNALCALASAVYLSLLGPRGLKKLAELNMTRTAHLIEELDKINGIKSPYFTGIPFKEFVFQLDRKFDVIQFESFLKAHRIYPGLSLTPHFPKLVQTFLSSATEMTTLSDIDQMTSRIREFISKNGG
jgi:glycine dehydrogenase subunit 1